MLRRVALIRTDVSEELSSSFIRVTRICELGTALAVTRNRRTLPSSSGYKSYSFKETTVSVNIVLLSVRVFVSVVSRSCPAAVCMYRQVGLVLHAED
jgi:hypothetical protein